MRPVHGVQKDFNTLPLGLDFDKGNVVAALIKLLLVDDEENTREGICSVVPWERLGVDQVMTADDGINGVEVAKEFWPDILLTDVRMPRMDGIGMAFEIRRFIPDCHIIFMSGYSDKEYLKSAIALSATAYIEKPLDISELREVISRTVSIITAKRQELQQAKKINQMLNISIPALKNQLAVSLLRKSAARGVARDYLRIVFPELTYREPFTTVLVSLLDDGAAPSENTPKMVCEMLEKQLGLAGIDAMVGIKDDKTIVAHLCLQREGELVSIEEIRLLCVKWKEMLESLCRFILIIGEPAPHVLEVCESFNSAVITLQKAFYYQPCEVLCSGGKEGEIYPLPEEEIAAFSTLIREEKAEEAQAFIRNLTDTIRHCDGTPVSLVKDYYTRLYELIPPPRGVYPPQRDNGRELIFHSFFLTELEALLLERLRSRFAREDRPYQNPVIEKIERYVGQRYGDPDLSLSSISAELNLSASYLCVLFKKETGITLNHYITQYRMEHAKKALLQDEVKIKQVANEVGYNDCNYFIKAFKKANGVTPMEFRELKRPGEGRGE